MSAYEVIERALRSYTEGEDAANIVLTVLAEEGYSVLSAGQIRELTYQRDSVIASKRRLEILYDALALESERLRGALTEKGGDE